MRKKGFLVLAFLVIMIVSSCTGVKDIDSMKNEDKAGSSLQGSVKTENASSEAKSVLESASEQTPEITPKPTAEPTPEPTPDPGVPMPNVEGKALPDALTNLQASGIHNVSFTSKHDTFWPRERLIVSSQSIKAGARVNITKESVSLECDRLCTLKITLKSDSNLLFNKYDLIVRMDDKELGRIKNGKSMDMDYSVTEGAHVLEVYKDGDKSVFDSYRFEIVSDASISSLITHGASINLTEKNLQPTEIPLPKLSFNTKTITVNKRDSFSAKYSFDNKGYETGDVALKTSPGGILVPDGKDSFIAAETGSATVIATLDGVVFDTCTVTVINPVRDIQLEQESIQIDPMEQFDINYKVIPEDAEDLNAIKITIKGNSIVQTDDGRFECIDQGESVVTFSVNNVKASCKVTGRHIPLESIVFEDLQSDASQGLAEQQTAEEEIETPPETEAETPADDGAETETVADESEQDNNLTVSEPALRIGSGEQATITVQYIPFNTTERKVHFNTTDTSVLKVDKVDNEQNKVIITGLKPGKATLCAIGHNGVEIKREIEVYEIKAESFSILTDTLYIGDTGYIEVLFNPNNTTNKNLSWQTSDRGILDFKKDGSFKAIKEGIVTVTAVHEATGLERKAVIEIRPVAETGIEIVSSQKEDEDFYPGSTIALSASVTPENATYRDIKWESEDEKIAKVSQKGVVTAVAPGKTRINAVSVHGMTESITIQVDEPPQKFKVNIDAKLVHNDHVGSKWEKIYEINDERVKSGDTISAFIGDQVTAYAEITEYDSDPDSDFSSDYEYIDEEMCKKGFTIELELYPTENEGRYSGNEAFWRVTFKFTPIK